MESRTLYIFLVTMYMTSALGVIIYCGMFSYSFQRRKLFILRLIASIIVIGSITNSMSYGLYYGFTHGIETSLLNIELIPFAEYPIIVANRIKLGFSLKQTNKAPIPSKRESKLDANRINSIFNRLVSMPCVKP